MGIKRRFLIFILLVVGIVNPGIEAQAQKVKRVVIDAGHGGHDPGAIGSKSKEKDVALAIALKTGSVTAGFAAAGIVGGIVTLLIAYCGIHLKLSQVAVGFVLTLLCRDMAYVLGAPYARIPGLTTTYMPIPILNKLPGIGPILFDHNLAVYSAMIMVPAVWFYFYKTSWGLDLLGLGEQPQAARIRGLPVTMMKYLYCAFGGLLIGLSGALFSLQVAPLRHL